MMLTRIVGIGVDVLHTPRINSLIQRRSADQLARRILSDSELAAWQDLAVEDEFKRRMFLATRCEAATHHIVHQTNTYHTLDGR